MTAATVPHNKNTVKIKQTRIFISRFFILNIMFWKLLNQDSRVHANALTDV